MAGLTVGGTESKNLLTRSEAFDHGDWSKSAASISADAAEAPNGETEADKLVESATTDFHQVHQSVAHADLADDTVHTWSVFVKAAGRSDGQIILRGKDAAVVEEDFDLDLGTITSNDASTVATSITAMRGGWYRISLSVDIGTGSTSIRCYIRLQDS